MLAKEWLWKVHKFEGIGSDSWNYNHINAGSVTSLKFSDVHTSNLKFAYGSLHNIILYNI